MRGTHGEVETLTFDGKTAQLADVLDELRSYGLMQQYKLVVVDDADQFVSNHREVLMRYAEAPVDNGTLVLRVARWYKSNLDKAIDKVGCVFKCEPMKQPEAIAWLMERATTHHGRKLDRATADILVRRLGVALGRLDTELAKLALLVGDGEPIDKKLIDEVVGRGSDEDAWAVQEAVLEALNRPGGGGAAIAKLHELVDLSGQPPILVSYFVADLMRKLHQAAMMRAAHVSDGQIARDLKLWGPRQTMFMSLLRRISDRSASRLFDRIVRADRRSKSGFGDALRNLEGFCAVLADEIQ